MSESNNPAHQPLLPEIVAASDIDLTPSESELLQTAHSGYEKIILEKEFGGGFSGTRVFLVLPVQADGASHARMVTKIGPAPAMQREKKNYDDFAGPALPFAAVQVKGYYPLGNQAALNYIFAGGGALGEAISLEDYYHTQPAEAINKTLDVLLDKTLGATWYGQHQPLNSLFREEYGRHLLPPDELAKIVKAIYPRLSAVEGKQIQIPGVSETYPDPLAVYPKLLNRTLKGSKSFVHGDLHIRNVLVDESGRAWLIDFAKVKKRHNLFDFIKLETYIRLMALAEVSGAFSLNEYAQFERALNQASTPPTNLELAKAYQVIRNIRQIARKYMGYEPNFKNVYFPALFLYSLSMLKYFPINGPIPTQLMFMTSCALAVDILKDDKDDEVEPVADKSKKTSQDKPSTKNEEAVQAPGGVSIGGNATGNVIVSGNQNKVNQTTHHIDTGGGAYVGGSVNIKKGDFVGRDKNITSNGTPSADEIAAVFTLLLQRVDEMRAGPAKTIAQTAVQELEIEAKKGQQADESNVGGWFSSLAQIAPDIWEVVVDTFIDPIKGISTVFQKIARHAKEAKEQRGRN